MQLTRGIWKFIDRHKSWLSKDRQNGNEQKEQRVWASALLLSYVSLAEGQSKCKENSKSKQTLTLASDGMARSLFPTILQNSLIHGHTN